MRDKVIFHCDCNSFYASVELLHYPHIRHLPVAVCGSSDERHGIILAKNEEAKKYHVQTAETVWQAKTKCPELILLEPHREEYKKYYKIINSIYEQYTDRVEPFGIDESWLDMSGSWELFGVSPREVADLLRARVKEETGLTISVGVSFNKSIAKLASDYRKPDAVTEITRENFEKIVWPMPVSALLFVGKRVQVVLRELGIETVGQLAVADDEMLRLVLGKAGTQLKQSATGAESSAVAKAGETVQPKSVGSGQTFRRDLLGERDVKVAVASLADDVAWRLRKHGLYANSLQVLIRDPDFKSISRQKPLAYATNMAVDLSAAGNDLIRSNWDFAKPMRMLTLTAQQLSNMPFAVQTSFLGNAPEPNKKKKRLEESVDSIRMKYGQTAVIDALMINNDIGVESESDIKDN